MRVVIDVGAGGGRHGVCVGAMADRKAQLELFDRALRRRLIVDRQRHDLDAGFRKLLAGALKSAELGLTIRAPRSAIDQHDAKRAPKRVGNMYDAASDRRDAQRGKRLAILQPRHWKSLLILD